MLTLLGVLIVIVGFALRFNPLLVVCAAGIVTGIAGHLSFGEILTTFGNAFVSNRYLSLFILTLPVVGLLERYGLKEQSQQLIGKIKAATTGRLLLVYLLIRQATAAIGLTSLGGHAQMVRPLVSPMAEGAAAHRHGPLPKNVSDRIKALSASTDNVGLFFGEDIFIAFGAVLLIQGFLAQNGIQVEPLHVSVWGIPTAIAAFVIHGIRLYLLDRKIKQLVDSERSDSSEVTLEEVQSHAR
ncbi:DUF969 domain-containing protein [Paenibacillus elgii]|uniref:DUF969 domain-containing protein n=1 Tax=Paenibacillus elgii TaxID=189691 RepID=A0A2T6FTA4_9BACL|nr:DUF969 domain-containing protein [Paenibacillus elgii]PUA35136.1 DUF969 domain-containing protein [Paenibacillus elgii]